MLSSTDLLLAGFLPGLVALAARQAALRTGWGDGLAWPLAVAVGYAAGHVALAAQASGVADALVKLASPREAGHWLPRAAALALVVAALAQRKRGGRVVALVLGAMLAIALPTRLLWGSVYLLSEWPRGEATLRIGGLAVLWLGVGWLITARLSPPQEESDATESNAADASTDHCRVGGAAATLSDALIAPLLTLVALGLAVVLATSGALSYALLAGVVVASLAGATLGGVGKTKLSDLGVDVAAAGPVVVALLGGLLLVGLLYAEVTAANAALLTAAAAAAGAKHGWAPARSWRAAVLRALACLAPLAIAVTLSGAAFSAAVSAEPTNPYENWQPPGE